MPVLHFKKVLSTLGMKEGEAIVHPWVNKSLERAQAKVEGRNFDIRKQLLKFDDVMNDQRKAIFSQRREIMEADDVGDIAADMRHQVIDDLVDEYLPEKAYAEQWDIEGLRAAVIDRLNMDLPVAEWASEDGVDREGLADLVARTARLAGVPAAAVAVGASIGGMQQQMQLGAAPGLFDPLAADHDIAEALTVHKNISSTRM